MNKLKLHSLSLQLINLKHHLGIILGYPILLTAIFHLMNKK